MCFSTLKFKNNSCSRSNEPRKNFFSCTNFFIVSTFSTNSRDSLQQPKKVLPNFILWEISLDIIFFVGPPDMTKFQLNASVFLLLSITYSSILMVNAAKHTYKTADKVPFFVNKIGPYSNPTETYEFYSLPFCQPQKIQHKHASIGEDLVGDHKALVS
jgi:hypothetical protein